MDKERNVPFFAGGVSPPQQRAIMYQNGQMLVLAGPGSGKTKVITLRVRYLIEEFGIPPEQILTITFTRAAAAEMKLRAVRECSRAKRAVFGTFHSVFYQIIRSSGYFQGFTFLSPFEQKEILTQAVRNICTKEGAVSGKVFSKDGDMRFDVWQMLSDIAYYKNTDRLRESAGEDFLPVFDEYMSLCREQKKLDFDDVLSGAADVLENRDEILSFWQKRFSYIQIDEFQDINPVQYRVVRLLSGKSGNLFVVGDDDQAIYSFRGSSPSFMKLFLDDHPKAQKVMLETNYRSVPAIIAVSEKCIKNNEDRFDKRMKPALYSETGKGKPGEGECEKDRVLADQGVLVGERKSGKDRAFLQEEETEAM